MQQKAAYTICSFYITRTYIATNYDKLLYKYESHYGKKKREFCWAGNVAAIIGLKLSDVTFLDNQLMYHNDSKKNFKTAKSDLFHLKANPTAIEQYRQSD